MSYPQGSLGKPSGEGFDRHQDRLGGAVLEGEPEPVRATGELGSGDMARDRGRAPLDLGSHPDWLEPSATAHGPSLGETLKRAREESGRSMAELSVQTRVHPRYLAALEQGDYSILPTRVFAIGYVRAYAMALGIDEQTAVERFKEETPDPSAPLQAPVGVAFEDVRRYSPRVIAAVAVLVVAVVGWNVFQRVSLIRATHPSDIVSTPQSWSLGEVIGPDPVPLSAAHPAPPDQTTPVLYVTPGLEEQLTGMDAAAAQAAAAAAAAAPPVQRAFNPRGAVYGASAGASQVVLQARKAAGIVVRMPDGRVLFARQLAAGESWRAPIGVAATVDVSDPSSFDVYLNGEHGGSLNAALTPLNQLNTRAQALARQAATEVAARAAQMQAQAQAQIAAAPSGGLAMNVQPPR